MPTFADVPHADLLARAFMTFLHSIGVVLRDPAFTPLMNSLDQHFAGKPYHHGSAPASTTDGKPTSVLPPASSHHVEQGMAASSSPPGSPGVQGNEPDSSLAGGVGVVPEGASEEYVEKMIDK